MNDCDQAMHDASTLAFEIIRTGHCSVCDFDIIHCVDDERTRRIGAYQHARMCLIFKEVGLTF